MSKIWICRGWKSILNVHERVLSASVETVGLLLDSTGSQNDRLFGSDKWPPMILDHGLQPGSRGGHSLIRYRVSEHVPGRRVEFEFEPMTHLSKFAGRHYFEVVPRNGQVILRHTIDVDTDFSTWIYWKIFIERIHDAVIEDSFDKAERNAGIPTPHRSRWSLYVRLLRWWRRRRK
jgi:hypothetical protein